MAQKVQTFLIDDLDGSEAEGTVFFGLGGAQYEIDLSTDHAKELRTTWLAISTLEGGSPVPPGGQVRTGARLPRAASANAARTWAKSRGLDVKDRGRVPIDISPSGGQPLAANPASLARTKRRPRAS